MNEQRMRDLIAAVEAVRAETPWPYVTMIDALSEFFGISKNDAYFRFISPSALSSRQKFVEGLRELYEKETGRACPASGVSESI
jgi:hypothetical protein